MKHVFSLVYFFLFFVLKGENCRKIQLGGMGERVLSVRFMKFPNVDGCLKEIPHNFRTEK